VTPEDVLYRAGWAGVTITTPDGTVTSYPRHAIIALPIDRTGYRIVGRLRRLSKAQLEQFQLETKVA
jgi:hypothetical protein